MAFELFERFMYRRRYPKFAKRRRRLVWRTPGPERTTLPGGVALSYRVPTVSRRKIRYLGRREVYPHSLHVHLAPLHRIREP